MLRYCGRRQWVVSTFGLWSRELSFSEGLHRCIAPAVSFRFTVRALRRSECIIDDVRNNSAWNYRYFVISGTETVRVMCAVASSPSL
jgi:hypothetical protein